MSTLTRSNSHSKKQYKDYVSFLDNYKNGKKDDHNSVINSDSGVNFSLTNSSNNSSSSVFSDVSDAAPKNGFREHLENFNNRKNNSVPSDLPKSKQQKHAVKTEVFIEIKNPPVNQNYTTKVFEVQNIDKPHEASISVSNATKIFEKNSQSDKGSNSLQPKNSFSKKSSIGEITKKFEDSSQKPNKRSPPKRAASIGEVSKIFEISNNVSNDVCRKQKNFNRVPKPFQAATLPKLTTETKVTLVSSPKPVISPKPVFSAPQFPKFTQDPPKHHQDNVDSAFSSLSISPSPPQSISPPPVLISTSSGPVSPPPPPPPPMPSANFSSKSTNGYDKNKVTSLQPMRNGSTSQKITVQSNEVPQQNGGTLNRNDPRVKKAVYGALRNMYGAYHDQANDYLATLPKNRVKKNNGLDNIINSIAQARLPLGPEFGPPPTLLHSGHIPSVRLKSEINNKNMDPPQCVQNAMMTKDKKPFTYTPGGIDLSEVRSPRMQRRIERNANLGGASDVAPQQAPRPQHVGPLPPATIAAMRPQPQVQVFPGPPPPPPMSKNIPPPPPPPSCPLPTQKVTTNDNQVLERPDMTKIIPDNPMALLRKTGGPAPKKSFVEQMYEEQSKAPLNPPSPPQRAYEAQSPRYPPPVTERSAPISPPIQQQRQPQAYQPPPQQYQPPTSPQNQYQPPKQSYQPQYQSVQPAQPQYQPVSPDSPKPSSYPPPIIERQSTLGRQDQPQRNISSSVGSLYIPPLNQQQQPGNQQKFASPPTPPEREPQIQSPGTPTLKEAPRPWQQKNAQQQQVVPPWAKREEEERVQSPQSPPSAPSQRWQQPARAAPPQQQVPQQVKQPPNQQFSPRSSVSQQSSQRSPPTQNQSYPSNSFPVHIEIRAAPYPQDLEPDAKTERVYVTQPIVLQHPGPTIAPPYQGPPKPQLQQQPSQNAYQQPRQQVQQKPKVDSSGARIIPIQVERTPPSTPGTDRGLSRQLSWGSQPTQSNSFKVIQKITRTDEDDDDDTPVTQHSPRYPQEMPEQVRKMKINDNGHFKQGNGQPQPYVHPSEQVVPEPKKYMGSNIPSRSFKILQAMTAPSDGCANANYNEELPYNPMYNPYNYPYYPPPYWPDYYANYYPQEQPELPKHNEKSSAKSGRSTPVPNPAPYATPYWNDYYANFYPQQQSDSSSKMSDKSSSTKSGRSTPLPTTVPAPSPLAPPQFWGYGPPTMPSSNFHVRSQSTPPKVENVRRPQTPKPNEYHNNYTEEALQYPPYHMYPPYYDPYYYSYYYGYPPMMSPYPYYPSTTDNEEYSGYSSQDEMSSYNSRKPSLKRRNSLENGSNSVQALKQHFEVRSKSATPRITITPSYSQEKLNYNSAIYKEKENRDFEIDIDDDDKFQRGDNLCRLQSVKSVQDIGVYAAEFSDTESSESEESTEEETENEEEMSVIPNGEEIIPHQLSVIFEESERGDSRRSFRPSSVTSETTTIAGHQSDEEDLEDFLAAQNVKYKINIFQEATEQISVKTSNGKTVKTFEQENELSTSLSVRNENANNGLLWFENKTDQSKHAVRKYESDSKIEQGKIFDNGSYEETRERVKRDTNKTILYSEKFNKPINRKEDQNTQPEEITEKVIGKKDNKSAEDWCDVTKNNDVTKRSDKKEISINKDDNECDTINLKAEYVMMHEEENEVVSVKLRNKNNARKNSSSSRTEEIISHSANVESKANDDLFFKTISEYNKSSVYDILKDNEDTEEIESGGTLMKVGSFVSALEAIKRNSGLWNLDEIDFGNQSTINEETDCQTYNSACEEKNESKEFDEYEASSNHSNECDEEPKLEEETANQSEESEIDFWSQIKTDEDDFKPRRQSQYFEEEQESVICNTHVDSTNISLPKEAKETDSASSRHSSFSKSQDIAEVETTNKESEANEYNRTSQKNCNNLYQNYNQKYQENNDNSDETSESESSEEDEEVEENQKVYIDEKQKRNSNSRSKSLEPQTIKERIEALRNSIAQKQKLLQEKEETSISVKNKISAIEVSPENRSKTTSTKSSVKSFEEYSEEEEGDSGVISDISRHISDNEEFPELKKLTRYERAATHSRLFKLLQDECDIEEEEEEDDVFEHQEDKFSKLSVRQNKLTPSRSKLSLALDKYNDNNAGSQVNEKLVEELIQSLFRSRKAQVFRNMPKEKLRAAAIIILQEGIEGCESPSEEFSGILSPLRGDTQSSTPAETPQEFYGDNCEYKQYYDSWSDATTEIGTSKALKLLQEHLGPNKLGTIEGILAKYPKILSNKNISKEILKHLDELSSDCSYPYSQTLPQSNDVTNT